MKAAEFPNELTQAAFRENELLARVERLTAERDEWKAAADTEARARREFHDKAERLTAENERLRRFVDFVNLWCYRDSKVSAAERLEAIRYHPTTRAAYQQQAVNSEEGK